MAARGLSREKCHVTGSIHFFSRVLLTPYYEVAAGAKQEALRELIGRGLPLETAAALVESYIAERFVDVDLTHERGVPPWDFDYFYRVPILSRTKSLYQEELTLRFYIVDGNLSEVRLSAQGASP